MTFYIVVAAMLALVVLNRFSESPTCIACGGKGRHRQGCPDE